MYLFIYIDLQVSPFLLDGIQNTDASMVLQIAGGLPPGVQAPALILAIRPLVRGLRPFD
jgi:hypothetical protein